MKSRLRPNRSPSVPPVSSRLANRSVYASTTHCSPETPACRLSWIFGSATFTTVLSSIAMNKAKHMAKRVGSLVCRFSANMSCPFPLRTGTRRVAMLYHRNRLALRDPFDVVADALHQARERDDLGR